MLTQDQALSNISQKLDYFFDMIEFLQGNPSHLSVYSGLKIDQPVDNSTAITTAIMVCAMNESKRPVNMAMEISLYDLMCIKKEMTYIYKAWKDKRMSE